MKITVTQNVMGATAHLGHLTWSDGAVTCALGAAGITRAKTEGDKATPVGTFPLRRLFYRPDRLDRPRTGLPAMALNPGLGWCDDVASPAYNRLVRRPCPWRHEILWRDDPLYDLIVIMGHNDAPPVPPRGSAIFLHVAGKGLAATEGCVAVRKPDLIKLIGACGPGDLLTVAPPNP